MDKQSMYNNETESVAITDTLKITKEECQQKSDAELLAMVAKAQGHTAKDFSEYLNCDFSYSYLTSILRDRGYENGWHKTSDAPSSSPKPIVIQMKKSDDEVSRQSYMLEKNIAEEWKQFNKNVPYKTVTLGWAMKRFMEDVKSGRIKFELEI